jgi:NADPH:quinone reductase-like Zn-dependent oxidoreductase
MCAEIETHPSSYALSLISSCRCFGTKAVVFHEHGGPEVLKFEDVTEPQPKPDEVLIKVRASGCNYNDIWARRGLPGLKVILPHISGSDLAGEVAEVGDQVTAVSVGDKVVIHPCLSCRTCEYCTSGREYFCRSFKIYGFETGPLDGSHAEYAKLPQANVIPMPNGLSFEEAASISLVFLTAWHMLVTRVGLQPGNSVLILGAGSGLGIAGVQIAKLFGAKVLATVGSDAKIEKAKKLGADEVLNHTTQDIAAEVRRLTNKRGVDVVFEHVGEATWEKSILSLAYGGKLVICGATTGCIGRTDLRHVFWKQLSLLGSHEGNKGELLTALRFVEEGKLKPVVDRVLPLEKAAEAQQIVESRQQFGKIVLTR